jgi:hypothetical protein
VELSVLKSEQSNIRDPLAGTCMMCLALDFVNKKCNFKLNYKKNNAFSKNYDLKNVKNLHF